MPVWLQTVIVLLIVAGAAGAVLRQLLRSLVGKRSRLGSCCAKGCPPRPATKPENRVAFVPVELLIRRHR